MANNITIRDASSVSRIVATTETATVHTPHRRDPEAIASLASIVSFLGNTTPVTTVASAARTTSGNSGIIASLPFGGSFSSGIIISAASGTTPTIDISLEETYDGTNWITVWQAPRRTTTGNIQVPPMFIGGRHRWSWVVAGTTPSFTFSVISTPTTFKAATRRQFFDRTIVPTTLNSTSAVFNIAGVTQLSARFRLSTLGTVAPQFSLEISDDGTNWVSVVEPISEQDVLVASGTTLTTLIQNVSLNTNFARFTVFSAGTGSVLDTVTLVGQG